MSDKKMSTPDRKIRTPERKTVKKVLTPSIKDCEVYCICQRYPSDVFCESAKCTFSGHGRVERTCQFHRNESYLLDLSSCPFCQSKCVEIFIPSIVGEDKQTRREPYKEELLDCQEKEIIPFLSLKQQPYFKKLEDLEKTLKEKLPREEYSIWKEMMRKRSFIIKKKYQMLLKKIAFPDLVLKITMQDLEDMKADLYEASKVEKDWRRSAAALKSIESPSPNKLQLHEEKLSPIQSPSNAQMRLLSISSEQTKKSPEKTVLYSSKAQERLKNIQNEPPRKTPEKEVPAILKAEQILKNIQNETLGKTPEKEQTAISQVQQSLFNAEKNKDEVISPKKPTYVPPHRRENPAYVNDSWRKPAVLYESRLKPAALNDSWRKPVDIKESWRKPMKDATLSSDSKHELEKKLQTESFQENLDAVEKAVLKLRLDPQEKPMPEEPYSSYKNTIIYYQSPQARPELERISSLLHESRKRDDAGNKDLNSLFDCKKRRISDESE